MLPTILTPPQTPGQAPAPGDAHHGNSAVAVVIALLLVAGQVGCKSERVVTAPQTAAPDPIALTDLRATEANLLVADGWSPLNDEVVGHIEGDVLHCPSAPPGVAEVDKPDDPATAGWQQTVTLDQAAPSVVVASVDLRAIEMAYKRQHDLSLTVELFDADGKHVGSSWTFFSQRQVEWQRASVRIVPPAAAARATVKLVSLSQAGRTEFRAPSLVQLPRSGELVSLDTFAIPAGEQLAQGWWVVDVHDPAVIVPLDQAELLGLRASARNRPVTGGDSFSIKVTDTSGADRALTLLYVLPVEGEQWRWLASPGRSSETASPGEYLVASGIQGGRGQLSIWPFAAITDGATGKAIVMDLSRPAIYRVGYSAGAGALYLAIDLALTSESPSAELGGRTMEFDGTWGFRGALSRYYEMFPASFASRTPEQGLWMPFGYIAGLPDWEDFGFRFSEGTQEIAFCDENDMYSLVYGEPLTWWMGLPADMPRDLESVIPLARKWADEDDAFSKTFFTSVYHNADGRPAGTRIAAAWCDGIVWSMNSAPGIAGDSHFSLHWDHSVYWLTEWPVDGVYIDSAEGYVTEELNYRREHFGAMETPLTFDMQGRPAIHTGLVAFEYVRAVSQGCHKLNKIVMANAVPGRYAWLAPLLDVMGGESDWNSGDAWHPPSPEGLLYIRAMVGAKPYCLLQNPMFEYWTYEHTERYIKRCTAFGMYPGFFSANAMNNTYFDNPDLYERDRDLFKKYIPLARRAGEAGWQPITNATVDVEDVSIERFGEDLLTVFNPTSETQTITITLTGPLLPTTQAVDLTTDKAIAIDNGTLTLTLASEDVAVIELK